MHVSFDVTLTGTYGTRSTLWMGTTVNKSESGGSWEFDVPFEYPPIASTTQPGS